MELRADEMPSQDAMNSLYDYFRTVFKEVCRHRIPRVWHDNVHVIVVIVFVVDSYVCTDTHFRVDALEQTVLLLDSNSTHTRVDGTFELVLCAGD